MKRAILKARRWNHPSHPWTVDLRPFGGKRKCFKHRAEAEAEALRQRVLLERHSRQAVGLSQHEMSEIIHARQAIAAYGETISDAVKFRIEFLGRVRRSGITVAQLTDEVLQAKQKDGVSKKYFGMLRLYLKRFGQDFGERAIAGITVEELDNWLRNLPVGPKSRVNYRANVGVLFGYAYRRRIIDSNPVTFTARPRLIDKAPEIFTVDELRALLTTAEQVAPDVLPMLVIGAFAGLRDAEIQRLDWNEIDLARGYIEVKAAKAKTARRRIVPILPSLAEWLRPYSGMTGKVVPANERSKINRVCEAAALARWPQNGLRHSFASYRLAATHDAPRVSSELGHTSPQLLFSAYRELVMPAEAERYWKITPAAAAANVVGFQQV